MDEVIDPERHPVLNMLSSRRVFVVLRCDKGFELREECDQHFAVQLTPQEVYALAKELIDLAAEAS